MPASGSVVENAGFPVEGFTGKYVPDDKLAFCAFSSEAGHSVTGCSFPQCVCSMKVTTPDGSQVWEFVSFSFMQYIPALYHYQRLNVKKFPGRRFFSFPFLLLRSVTRLIRLLLLFVKMYLSAFLFFPFIFVLPLLVSCGQDVLCLSDSKQTSCSAITKNKTKQKCLEIVLSKSFAFMIRLQYLLDFMLHVWTSHHLTR